MVCYLKLIQAEKDEGKSATKSQEADNELANLMTFNQTITHTMARTMQDLSDFVSVYLANMTLVRRDSHLDFLKRGVKVDSDKLTPSYGLSIPRQCYNKGRKGI